MANTDRRLWPFSTKASLISAGAILIGLPILVAVLRETLNWPSEESDTTVLIGILVLSLLPIVLVLLDLVVERGGSIEYRGIKVDFSQSRAAATVGITVAPNIGVPGKALSDSNTAEILDTLKQATATDIVVIDLEDGEAWWETRLMVLLAGADRLGRPDKIVFVGTDGGKERQFQGWAHASDLFRRFLHAHPNWEPTLQATRTAARQWDLVEPLNLDPSPLPGVTANASEQPVRQRWFGPLASNKSWMLIDPVTGRRNELFAEQVLQSELGREVEEKGGSPRVNLVRLEELFRPILIKDELDLSWTADKQLKTALDIDAPFVALTEKGTYSALVSKLALLNEVVKSLVEVRKSL